MGDFASRAFASSWIDARPRAGKVGGAYCIDFPEARASRVLCNFDGSFNSVTTVAHELGHAWHAEAVRGLPYVCTRYPMTLAETASIFAETLVFESALKAAAPAEKAAPPRAPPPGCLPGHRRHPLALLLRARGLLERRAKAELGSRRALRAHAGCAEARYGEGLDAGRLHPYMWLVKGHYYSTDLAFYNFPYAFGQLFGAALYARYEAEGPAFAAAYRGILEDTGRASAVEVAAKAGFDIEKPDFWREGLERIRAAGRRARGHQPPEGGHERKDRSDRRGSLGHRPGEGPGRVRPSRSPSGATRPRSPPTGIRTRAQRALPARRRAAEGIVADTDPLAVATGKDVIILAVPSPYLMGVVRRILCAPNVMDGESLFVVVTKGFVPAQRGRRAKARELILETLEDYLPGFYRGNTVYLSGPSHAEEVSRGKITGLAAASQNGRNAIRTRELFRGSRVLVFPSLDTVGVQVCAAAKNVVAIAFGMLDAIAGRGGGERGAAEFGDNTESFLLAAGLNEMQTLGDALGATHPETFTSIAGVGDLDVTCRSVHGRNRRFGREIVEKGILKPFRDLDDLLARIGELGYLPEGAVACKHVARHRRRAQARPAHHGRRAQPSSTGGSSPSTSSSVTSTRWGRGAPPPGPPSEPPRESSATRPGRRQERYGVGPPRQRRPRAPSPRKNPKPRPGAKRRAAGGS